MTILRKGIAVSINAYAVMILGIVQVMILSRALGPSGVGELSLYRQTVLLGVTVSSLGWPMAMIYWLNQKRIEPGKALASIALATGMLSILCTSVVLGFLWWESGSFFPVHNIWVLLGVALWIPSWLLRAVFYNYELAQLNTRSMIIIELAPQALLTFWLAYSWMFGLIDVTYAVMSESIIIGVFSLIISLVLVRPWRIIGLIPRSNRIDYGFLWDSLRHGIMMASSSILLLLNGYLSLVLLRTLTDDFDELGYFSRGFRLATIVGLSFQVLSRLLYSNWSGMEAERRSRSVERTVNVTLTLVIIMGSAVFLAAKPLTILLFGQDFIPAVPVTQITIGAVSVFIIVRLLQSMFNADNKSIYNVLILVVGLITNALGCVWLIPELQAQGAAWALVASYLFMAMFALLISKIKYGLRFRALLMPSATLVLDVLRSLFKRKGYSE